MGPAWFCAGRFAPYRERTEVPGAAGLAGRGAAPRGAGVTAAAFRRKSSIIVAADDSTISWGPSPTFGELVSRPLPRAQSPAWAP